MGDRGKVVFSKEANWSSMTSAFIGLIVMTLGGITILLDSHPFVPAEKSGENFICLCVMMGLGFILSGISLTCHSLQKLPRLTLLSSGIAFFAGWLILIAHWGGLHWMEPWLPSAFHQISQLHFPSTAIGLAGCSTALFLQATRLDFHLKRLSVWILASLSLALCLTVLGGYSSVLTDSSAWNEQIAIAKLSATGLAFLSLGLLVNQKLKDRSLLDDGWLPLAPALITATATIIVWFALRAEQHDVIRKEATIVAENLSDDIRDRAEQPLRAFERMKRRWNQRNGTPLNDWHSDARGYMMDDRALYAMGLTNPDGQITTSEPEKLSGTFDLAKLSRESNWDIRKALMEAREKNITVLSPSFDIEKDNPSYIAFVPLFTQDRLDGFMVGAFHLKELMQEVAHDSAFKNQYVSIYEGNRLIHGFQTAPPDALSITSEAKTDFHGHSWRFVIHPNAATVTHTKLPLTILIIGLFLAITLGAMVRGLQSIFWRNRAMEYTHLKLQEQVIERQKAEREKSESEELLSLVLNAATGVSVISADSTGLITYFSKGSEKMLGYSAAEMVGRKTPVVFHDLEEVERRGRELTDELEREIQGFEVFITLPQMLGSERREWTYICKDGTRRTVELTVSVLSRRGDEPTSFLGTAIDVTERNKTEQQLRETLRAKESAQSLLEAAGRIARLGHWEVVLGRREVYWSEEIYTIHGIEQGTPVSVDQAISYYHPDDQDRVKVCVTEAIHAGAPFDFEARIIHSSGAIIWIHSRGEPIRDEAGKVVAVHGVAQDITEQRLSRVTLEERNRQLEIATARAEAHAQAKADFLANMSHEIRTPLNAVIGMSALLMDSKLEPREREFVETIHNSGDVLLALINDILDFSKIESGKFDIESIPLQLRDCIESTLDLMAAAAARKNIDLAYWVDPEVPLAIYGDPTRLRQILVNLVSNAIKFTNSGEVFVKLSSIRREDGSFLHVAVHDTGIGIPPERMDRLFNSFSQVDASTTRRYGGTGLGLAISQRLVDKMGGRIWVESEVRKGSVFKFEIPLRPAKPIHRDLQEDIDLERMKGMRILIVDDNETNRRILGMQIASWGMQSVAVEDAEAAIQLIHEGENFNLAILDVMMPRMNGYTLATLIRKQRSREALPILMLSSMGDHQVNAGQLEVSAILTKPIKVQPLFNAVRDALIRRSAPREITEHRENEKAAETHPLRILVAEDNPVNQRVVTLLLQRMGYQPRVVANGLEALDALVQGEFQVILLDVEMPEMDGLTAARNICQLYPEDERPWMIALTARAAEEDRENCLAAGMNDYLSKPIRKDHLEEALKSAFRHLA
jgi:PAS domain S-box-containing protein